MYTENPFSLVFTPSGIRDLIFGPGFEVLLAWTGFFLAALSVLGCVVDGRRHPDSADLAKCACQVQVGFLYLICTLTISASLHCHDCRHWARTITALLLQVLAVGLVVLAGELVAIRLRFGRGVWRHDWAPGLLICPLLDLCVLIVCISLVLARLPTL